MNSFPNILILKDHSIRHEHFLIESNSIPFGYTNSSPCQISNNVFNVRLVNYYINKSTKRYHMLDSNCNAINMVAKSMNLFNGKLLMKEIYNVPIYEKCYAYGIEDIRLHKTSEGQILFLGTSPSFNKQNYNRVCFGLYDIINYEILVNKVYRSPMVSDCEKNWVFFNDEKLIYHWYPLRIYSLDTLKLLKTIITPEIFSEFRGSTSILQSNGFNYVVTHSVVSGKYLHHLVVLDDEGNPIKYSKSFSFEGEDIEFCLSFFISKSNIIQFHYSLWDCCTKKMDLPFEIFEEGYINL
jgi:hypothetical protein